VKSRAFLASTLLLMLIPTIAGSHPIQPFDACVKARGVADLRCRNKAEVGAGVEVVLRATLEPPHENSSAVVARLAPHAEQWQRVAETTVLAGGKVRWFWTPQEGDIHNYTAWRFRFKIRDHGWSDVVKVLVRSDEF